MKQASGGGGSLGCFFPLMMGIGGLSLRTFYLWIEGRS